MMKGAEILIVEDSLTQAGLLKLILERNNYQVSIACNGEAALELISNSKPAIVISDVVMPGMDGFQLCTRLKEDENSKDIPVILLTSLSDPVDVIKGLKCGANNFVTKPYQVPFLLSSIKHVLVNTELRKSGHTEMGIEVYFAGQKHFVNSERIQIIDLLLSTYENAVQKALEIKKLNKDLTKAIDTIKILEENYRSILENNPDATIVVSSDGTALYINPTAKALFGCEAGKDLRALLNFPLVSGETREFATTCRDGAALVVEMRVVGTNWEGESAYLTSLRDVTENVRLRERLRSLSLTDDLTGLYNRRGFFALAKKRLKEAIRSREWILLVFIDLDHFKSINDTFGHQVGDQALIEAATALSETFRDSDIVARIGGDEFVVIMPCSGKVNAEILIKRLQENLISLNTERDYPYRLSMSAGFAKYNPLEPCTIDELLARAEKLMYEQKRRNT